MSVQPSHKADILLSLSIKIARAKAKDELLTVINTELTHILPFDDCMILRYNNTNKTAQSYISSANGKRYYNIDHPVLDDSISDAHTPILNYISPPLPISDGNLSTAENPEMKQCVTIKLIEGVALIGFWVILFTPDQVCDQEIFELLRKISYPIAIAAANIIAAEDSFRNEEEKNKLLLLSNEIAALKTREDLSIVVNTRIKKLLSVSEFGIAQIDEGGETYSAFVLDFSDKTRGTPGFHVATSAWYSTTDPIFTEVKNSEDPIWFNVAEVAKKAGMPAYVKFWKEAEHKYYLHVPLRVGGALVGFVSLHFESMDAAKGKSMLLNGICAQIGVAVSNILANEKMLAREQEKNLLLSLSNEIASVKDREGLLKVVHDNIKELFSVKQLGFSKINEGGDTYSIFLIDVGEPINRHPDLDKIQKAKYDVHEALFKEVIASEDPILYNVSDLLRKPKPSAYINFLASTGAEQLLTVALRVGGIPIGTAQFVIENGVQFDAKSTLLKGVCSQLAVAISNILTTENNREREIEKTKLLDFSNAIAAIHDKMQFLKMINTKLKDLFRFSHAMIACINEDKKSCITYILEPQGENSAEWDYGQVLIDNIPLKNIVFQMVSSGFVSVDLYELIGTGLAPGFIQRNYNIGCLEMLLAPLKEDNTIIGFFMLFAKEKEGFDNNQLNMLAGVSHQLSIAAANIVANEKIQKQLAEINSYKQRLEEENFYLQQEIETSHNHSDIIGSSPAIKSVLKLVEQVAPSDSTVLILGETGTGKELIARAIHNSSPRKKELMIKINCAALPASLIESELFGHERGSFTGALDRRIGKFELANRSTLFLDEIGELPLELQVKLLRALQEKEIERIGGKTTIKIDVRIIAATNRNLDQMIKDGRFRLDLYYRLHIFPILSPPLRERKEDIPVLAAHFVSRFAKKAGKNIGALNAKVLKELMGYDWPGNIRELEHVIERSVVLTNNETIHSVYLPVSKTVAESNQTELATATKTLQEQEKEYILKILKQVNGRISGDGGAARLLGMPPSTLNSKLKRLGIHRDHHG
jgi:transcriptional regulator with GAF, ATPase, and Fis domain